MYAALECKPSLNLSRKHDEKKNFISRGLQSSKYGKQSFLEKTLLHDLCTEHSDYHFALMDKSLENKKRQTSTSSMKFSKGVHCFIKQGYSI